LEEGGEGKKYRVNKLLFLAYAQKIHKVIAANLQMENSPEKCFLDVVGYRNPMEEPYYQIFFNDNQLL
jgi:hypothetical protein